MFKDQYPNAVHKFAKLAETRHETHSLATHPDFSDRGNDGHKRCHYNGHKNGRFNGHQNGFNLRAVSTAIKNAITTVIKTAVYFH